MTWIKICGTTNLEDALTAVEAGADAIGFVFYENSPRRIDPGKAREIVDHLPGPLEKVGVFVNQQEDFICSIADRVGLTGVQMHGDNEDPHVAGLVVNRRPGTKILAAVSMHRPNPDTWAMRWQPDIVQAFLLDSGTSSIPGGTGVPFDWRNSIRMLDVIKTLGRVVAAGGLRSENVSDAIGILKPWGVDVVSGVEASPGKKDPDKVRAFVKAVRDTDRKTS